MGDCIKNCKLCNNLVLSTAVNFGDGTVLVQLPDTVIYLNDKKYCIVIAQAIPESATITAPVVFTVGTNQYPFLNKDCTPVTVSQITTRRIYPTKVNTSIDSGVFKYVGNRCLPSATVQPASSLATS